jgi:hypothetical protein
VKELAHTSATAPGTKAPRRGLEADPARWQKGAVFSACLTVVLLTAGMELNREITAWVEGPRFQAMLDHETSKGLKLQGSYGPLERIGLLGLRTGSFRGSAGYKTIVTLETRNVTGTFNPLGIILRRWEIDSVRIQSGMVMLQKTRATPGANKSVPWPPWWALFWPYRVHLADVRVEDAKILWKLRDKESGIYDTHLEITPNGRDFEYDAKGGELKTPMTPELEVEHAHMLIRKPRLYCSEFILGDDPAHPEEQLRLEGDAGLQDDRSMRLQIDLAALKVAPWLPPSLRAHVEGHASGHFAYASSDTGLATGHGEGSIVMADGVLRGLALVRQYVTLTGSPDPGEMVLKTCRADVHWDAGTVRLDQIEVECAQVFRLTGTMTIGADKTLSGQVEFGLTDPYLHWLPTARSAIFTRDDGPYHFTTIHFSGTTRKPQEDLSPRLTHEVAKSPVVAMKLFFNQAGEWFDFN